MRVATWRRPMATDGDHEIGRATRRSSDLIGINLMGGMALARPWHPINRRDPHPSHEGGHLASPNGDGWGSRDRKSNTTLFRSDRDKSDGRDGVGSSVASDKPP